MTKQEILDALEHLKELTNNEGKTTIDGIKAGVMALDDSKVTEPVPELKPAIVKEEIPLFEEKEEVFAPKNRHEKPKTKKASPKKARK